MDGEEEEGGGVGGEAEEGGGAGRKRGEVGEEKKGRSFHRTAANSQAHSGITETNVSQLATRRRNKSGMMDECNIRHVVGGGRRRPEGHDKETMRAESPAAKRKTKKH